MGVRVYTSNMPTKHVVIDWSDLFSTEESAPSSVNVDGLIDWIKTYPRKKDVHVYLRSPRQDILARKLKNTLQALGCTVTAKVCS